MKRMILAAAAIGAVAAISSVAVAGGHAPKATGGYGYSYGSVQRHVSFAAIQSTTDTCGVFWNVSGTTTITITYGSSSYTHSATLVQTGESITGSGGYPATGTQSVTWDTTGTVSGSTINLTWDYTYGLTGQKNLTGTIASDGSISGTWTDNVSGTRSGTWTAPAGTAHATVSYCGKGTFYYSDEQGNWYFGVVKAVSVSGDDAWYAAQIVAGNLGIQASPTNYLFVHVHDGGEPGIGVDTTGGELMNAAGAVSAVVDQATPSIDGISINSGNIQVH